MRLHSFCPELEHDAASQVQTVLAFGHGSLQFQVCSTLLNVTHALRSGLNPRHTVRGVVLHHGFCSWQSAVSCSRLLPRQCQIA